MTSIHFGRSHAGGAIEPCVATSEVTVTSAQRDASIVLRNNAIVLKNNIPQSILAVSAEVKLGLTSPEQFNAIKAAMARAHKADRAGNRSACEQALADLKRLLRSAGTQTDDAQRWCGIGCWHEAADPKCPLYVRSRGL